MSYVEAKYRELLEEIESTRLRIAEFTAELQGIEEALSRLENLPDDAVLYERAGHIYVRRTKEETLIDLKARGNMLSSLIEELKKKENRARTELKQLVESVKAGEAGA
jgi:chaperonin cofactor prefoldin